MTATRWLAVTAAIVAATALVPAAARAQGDSAAQRIAQLGDESIAKREAAEQALVEMGPDALPALDVARKSANADVSFRAARAFEAIAHPSPEAMQALRNEGREAFRNADYARMALAYRRLAAAANATFDDLFWAGNGWQLAGEWRKAAEAYRAAARALNPNPTEGDWQVRSRGYQMGMLIARIELGELRDPAAAVKTLTETLASLDRPAMSEEERAHSPGAQWPQLTIDLLLTLADTQERLGDTEAALATWGRLDAFCRRRGKGYTSWEVSPERIAALLAKLPPDRPRPDFRSIFTLTPDKPAARLMLDEEATRLRACRTPLSPGPFWEYAFMPPPGQEFETIEFACDIEQLKMPWGGQFSCYLQGEGRTLTRRSLGNIGWPNGKPLGREVRRATFRVPRGVRIVRIETGSGKGTFNVFSVDVEATFREAAKDAGPVRAVTDGSFQTEVNPKGGTMTFGDEEIRPDANHTEVRPGRYHVRYEVAGREDAFETDIDIEPAGRNGFFANLDSPFRWTQGPKPRPGEFASTDSGLLKSARGTLAQLSDRSWLAAFSAPGDKIGVSRSKDLVAWEPAELPPFNSIFTNLEPSLLTTSDGTVWLAYLSKRLSPPDPSSDGYSIWLTSTRDGRTWTPLRPVSAPGVGNLFVGPQMLQRRDGSCWIFWYGLAASAKSFADIRDLAPVTLAQPKGVPVGVNSFCVAEDDAGLLHMFFTSSQGVFHATSKDGRTWEATRQIMVAARNVSLQYPKAVFSGGQAVFFFSINDGAYAARLRTDDRMLTVNDGLKITNHVVPIGDSPAMLTRDGDVLLMVGKETSWLLRAKFADLVRAMPVKE